MEDIVKLLNVRFASVVYSFHKFHYPFVIPDAVAIAKAIFGNPVKIRPKLASISPGFPPEFMPAAAGAGMTDKKSIPLNKIKSINNAGKSYN